MTLKRSYQFVSIAPPGGDIGLIITYVKIVKVKRPTKEEILQTKKFDEFQQLQICLKDNNEKQFAYFSSISGKTWKDQNKNWTIQDYISSKNIFQQPTAVL